MRLCYNSSLSIRAKNKSCCYKLYSACISTASELIFHKLNCAGKPQMRAIHTYVGCTKATTNDWDIRPSVAVKALSANISWTAGQIHTIELVLGSAHQSVSNNI